MRLGPKLGFEIKAESQDQVIKYVGCPKRFANITPTGELNSEQN